MEELAITMPLINAGHKFLYTGPQS